MPDGALADVLGESRRLGFLGPGPIEEHLAHARGFVDALPPGAAFFVDLGSGGGVPGLVIAWERPDLHGALLDGSTRRGAFLEEAVDALELSDRITVWVERAEVVARDVQRRGTADLVVARSFGPPGVVAECAAPLLKIGGTVIVSDPPSPAEQDGRWPAAGLAEVGLRVDRHESGPPALTILGKTEPCPDRYPRRVGIPAKRPIF